VCPFCRDLVFCEDRFDWTLGNARIAIDASLGINPEHIVIEMKSLNRADKRAVSIAAVHAWFCNYVSHPDSLLELK